MSAFADDAKSMVLEDRGAANSSQQALLHAALELDDCDLGGGNFNLDGNLTEREPGNENAVVGISMVSV